MWQIWETLNHQVANKYECIIKYKLCSAMEYSRGVMIGEEGMVQSLKTKGPYTAPYIK